MVFLDAVRQKEMLGANGGRYRKQDASFTEMTVLCNLILGTDFMCCPCISPYLLKTSVNQYHLFSCLFLRRSLI